MRAKRYWWVNHKQTHQQELRGGYLWSPKTEKNGVRSQFYDNMLEARSGDVVVSYANTAVRAIGRVTDAAFAQFRPSDFGHVGEQWDESGWLLPVTWRQIEPVFPRQILEEVRPLLPQRYSPLQHETGSGNQKAYLAEIGQDLFELISSRAVILDTTEEFPALDRDLHLAEHHNRLEAAVLTDPDLSETTRRQVVDARRGQGVFRQNVSRLESCCRITGTDNPGLLIASHIKPWRACSSAAERLDGNNGFLFAPHVDRLFDRGLISIGIDGRVLVSRRIGMNDLTRLGLPNLPDANIGEVTPRQAQYIAYHRENEFDRIQPGVSNEDAAET